MDQYELYCLADSLFYDRLGQAQTDASDFALVRRPLPDGWARHDSDTWIYYVHGGGSGLPAQGWKIHLSACAEDAERALETMWDYCVPRKIAFKYLRGLPVLVTANSKSASRSGSGKLATIYPRDEAELEHTLTELAPLLADVRGPYVLSDLRFGKGPLYVRYGGFVARRTVADNGELVPAIVDGSGKLVPDVRGSVFSVPEWTTLPAFLEPHLAARNAVTIGGLPYDIESVLQFSNGGGVYLGRDKQTGERVVLKEGRPHAGLDASGRDAVTRIRHERDILRRLSGLDVVPRYIDFFTVGEHEFLVQEFVDGNPLQRKIVQRYPLTKAACSPGDLADYANWAVAVLAKVEAAVSALHERGVVFGDLQPTNILITASGRTALIDFEVATWVEDEARSALAHPAFVAPSDRRGVEVDRYTLACLVLGLFAPQATITLPLHRAGVHRLADLITETFPVPVELIDDAVRTIAGPEPAPPVLTPLPGVAPWPETCRALHTAILNSATPERDDRLFPGDVAQFEPGGGLNLAHGAAGVLLTLAETGVEPAAEHVTWLAERATKPISGGGLGLYDGLHGVAYALDRLGRHQTALDVLDLSLSEHWEELGLDLYSGLAGIGLNLLHLGCPDLAQRAVERCAERLGGPLDVAEISGGQHPRAGLMHGSSGPALLFLHAYERGGDPALLDLAATALRQDLRRCIRTDDGSLQVNQGWRYLPYLAEGSVGIAQVLDRYLAHRADEEFSAALTDLMVPTGSQYFVQPGLFMGRAGIIAALDRDDPRLPAQIRGLRWHALPYGGGLAFPGDQLMRLSMDLATGTAGVLYALAGALGERPIRLPFLEPPESPGATPERQGIRANSGKEV